MRSQIKTNHKWAKQIVLITKFQNNATTVIDTTLDMQMKKKIAKCNFLLPKFLLI